MVLIVLSTMISGRGRSRGLGHGRCCVTNYVIMDMTVVVVFTNNRGCGSASGSCG